MQFRIFDSDHIQGSSLEQFKDDAQFSNGADVDSKTESAAGNVSIPLATLPAASTSTNVSTDRYSHFRYLAKNRGFNLKPSEDAQKILRIWGSRNGKNT